MSKEVECPAIVKLGFNPYESLSPVFKDSLATILWT